LLIGNYYYCGVRNFWKLLFLVDENPFLEPVINENLLLEPNILPKQCCDGNHAEPINAFLVMVNSQRKVAMERCKKKSYFADILINFHPRETIELL